MTIFKAFLQILNRNKGILILYSAILICFSIFSLQSNESTINFEATNPDIYILNHDSGHELSDSLVKYLSERSNVIDLPSDPESLDDALFYRRVNFIMEIPEHFSVNYLAGENPEIDFRSTGDYNASLAEMSLQRYLETAGAYRLISQGENELVQNVESTLGQSVTVELTAHTDTSGLNRAAFYYNFLNYPLIAGCIFMICLTLLSFRNSKVTSRIKVGAISPERVNRILLVSNLLFALVMWLIYIVLSFWIAGTVMFSVQGLWFIGNSLAFTGCITAMAFLIAQLVNSRNALNGIVNVIGLGSSFLCGAFVPLVWLPGSVKAIAHLLPSYWYIDANEQIKLLETFSWETLLPIILNITVVIIFTVVFVLAANYLSRHRQDR